MINKNVGTPVSRKWDSILFFSAGILMLVNVAFLWIRYYSNVQLSILWAAVPGIFALTASIIGLLKLHPRVSSTKTPWLAHSGAGFALMAGVALSIATIWIFSIALFSGGISEPLPNGVQALIGVFLVAMVMAFIFNAAAFLINSSSRNIGYLLMVPVASWGLMFIVGIINGLESGLSLDQYTNGLIAVAFLSIGFLVKKV